MKFSLLLLVLLPVFAVGCAPTYSFRVAVMNDTPQPVWVWLTKDGPPLEDAWLSPEDLAKFRPFESNQAVPGEAVIMPGQIRETPVVKGKFPEGVHAVLRAYVGWMKFSQLLAISRDSADRVDVTLPKDGLNEFTLTIDRGRLTATRGIKPPATQPGTR